jgi:hypothetical protein
MLKARLPEIKSVPELMRVISALSKISENDLAAEIPLLAAGHCHSKRSGLGSKSMPPISIRWLS